MPFGAEPLARGGVRFALWAPAAMRVELCLEGAALLPMERHADGWARVIHERGRPGDRYRFRIDGRLLVPDPASRFQPEDMRGPSEVVDPEAFEWTDAGWPGRPWEEMVFYELHVGTFTPEGTFAAVEARLDHLADLGVTGLQLMPIGDFPGRWNWGYDGVLPFAPDSRYGRPEALKALVQACHARGIAVFLDVVYNHFGPEGNYLGAYAPAFFRARHATPWDGAINFDGPGSREVRAFFRENALFWLEEYHLDGLRFDAVHAIRDTSPVHILDEIAEAVHAGPGAACSVHLVLENDANEARYLRPDAQGRRRFAAQWNDDIHHALHVLATGERDGYYVDYPDPVGAVARGLAEGFAYQGEHSSYRGRPRGEKTAGVPLTAFVSFVQNHDQVGNRAFGERLRALAPASAVKAVTALVLLAPSPPLMFMGEEWAAAEPFLFFCDFGPGLAGKVREGRRREFAHFFTFRDATTSPRIPDPQDERTVRRSTLDWSSLSHPECRRHRQWIRQLLRVRQQEIVPRLALGPLRATVTRFGATGFGVEWACAEGTVLRLVANLGPALVARPSGLDSPGRRIFIVSAGSTDERVLGAWHVAYYLADER